jgi:hypothetical protein
MPLIEEF